MKDRTNFVSRLPVILRERFKSTYMYYQPEYLSPKEWESIDSGNLELFISRHAKKQLDRMCVDRAITMYNSMTRQMGDIRERSLLDIGCNTGFFSLYFARKGMQVTGVDSNSDNKIKGTTVNSHRSVIEIAQDQAKFYGLTAQTNFIEDEIENIVESKDVYDVVLCLSIVHHFFVVGKGYGVKKETDVNQMFRQIVQKAKKLLYFEIDHRIADRYGWEEKSLPLKLKELGSFRSVNVIGISIDGFKRYRNIYECVR